MKAGIIRDIWVIRGCSLIIDRTSSFRWFVIPRWKDHRRQPLMGSPGPLHSERVASYSPGLPRFAATLGKPPPRQNSFGAEATAIVSSELVWAYSHPNLTHDNKSSHQRSKTVASQSGVDFIQSIFKTLPGSSVIPLRDSTLQDARDDCGRLQPAFPTGIFKRFSAAAVVDSQLLQHSERFWILDEPVGNGRITITVNHQFGSFGGNSRFH